MRIVENTSLAAKGALAHRLQLRTACKIQNGRQGAPKNKQQRLKTIIPCPTKCIRPELIRPCHAYLIFDWSLFYEFKQCKIPEAH